MQNLDPKLRQFLIDKVKSIDVKERDVFALEKKEIDKNTMIVDELLRYFDLSKEEVMNFHGISSMKINEEQQYLSLMRRVLAGTRKDNTLSVFHNTMKFTLSNSGRKILPLITTKNMLTSTGKTRGIFEELSFFLKGQTDNRILQAQNVHIWDMNSSTEYLHKRGLNYREGDLGPIYGFQWRHFGAQYKGCDHNYDHEGFDQIAHLVEEIKRNPFSRRLVVSSWNPPDLHKMALPPCHVMFIVNVMPANSGEPKYLNLHVTQRSADVPLGMPFNITSYSLLAHILAEVTGLQANEFVYTTIDNHIYLNQIEPAKRQLTREPYPFPEIEFSLKNIEDFNPEQVKILNYRAHPYIKYPLTV